MKLQITLPWPDPALNPNRSKGVHWASASAKRAIRLATARCIALQGMKEVGYVPPQGKLALALIFMQPDRRRRDTDNLLSSFKHDLDGISQALGVDDCFFDPLTIRREYGAKPGLVRVEVG